MAYGAKRQVMRTNWIPVVALTAAFLLAACGGRLSGASMSCEQIVDEALLSLDLDSVNQVGLQEWILATYQAEPEIATYHSSGSEMTESIFWTSQGVVRSGAFRDEELKSIVVKWESTQPTGDEILECFGPPDLYQASYRLVPPGVNQFDLQLLYLDQGIVVGLTQFDYNDQPPTVHADSQMTDLVIVRPRAVEEVVAAAYFPRAESVVQEVVQSLRPWPGAWEDIQVDVDLRPLNETGS